MSYSQGTGSSWGASPGYELMKSFGQSYGSSMGQSAAMGTTMGMSDERLKENIEPIDNALDKVLKLNGKTYNFIGRNTRDAGVIAQDLEKVLPEAVAEDGRGIKYVKFNAIIGLLVNAIKELAEGSNG